MSSYTPQRRSIGARVLRVLGRVALVLVALVVVVVGSVYGLSYRMQRATYDVPDHALTVRSDSAAIARGAHLATIRGCVDCHGPDLAGAMMIDDAAVGKIGGANLTNGRVGGVLSDRDWERAVRHGVRRDGTPLSIMPSTEFTAMSDEDLAALAAYARSLPANPKPPLPVTLGPALRAMAVAKQVKMAAEEVDHAASHPVSVAVEPTPVYGRYLAAGCTGCHGTGFSGGKIPGAPPDWKPAANITPSGIGRYTRDDFVRVLRTGKRPDGSAVDSLMPWKLTKHMTDTEIDALYLYLRTVPARDFGSR